MMKKIICIMLSVLFVIFTVSFACAVEENDETVSLPRNVINQFDIAQIALSLENDDVDEEDGTDESEEEEDPEEEQTAMELAERHAFIGWAQLNGLPCSRKLQEDLFHDAWVNNVTSVTETEVTEETEETETTGLDIYELMTSEAFSIENLYGDPSSLPEGFSELSKGQKMKALRQEIEEEYASSVNSRANSREKKMNANSLNENNGKANGHANGNNGNGNSDNGNNGNGGNGNNGNGGNGNNGNGGNGNNGNGGNGNNGNGGK